MKNEEIEKRLKKEWNKTLYDSFEIDRDNTLKVFESKKVKELTWIKFGKNVQGNEVKIDL